MTRTLEAASHTTITLTALNTAVALSASTFLLKFGEPRGLEKIMPKILVFPCSWSVQLHQRFSLQRDHWPAEELYGVEADPNEFVNLALRSEYAVHTAFCVFDAVGPFAQAVTSATAPVRVILIDHRILDRIIGQILLASRSIDQFPELQACCLKSVLSVETPLESQSTKHAGDCCQLTTNSQLNFGANLEMVGIDVVRKSNDQGKFLTGLVVVFVGGTGGIGESTAKEQ